MFIATKTHVTSYYTGCPTVTVDGVGETEAEAIDNAKELGCDESNLSTLRVCPPERLGYLSTPPMVGDRVGTGLDQDGITLLALRPKR